MTIDEAVKYSGGKNVLDAGSRKYAQNSLFPNETLLFAFNCNYSIAPSYERLDPRENKSVRKAIKTKRTGVFAVTDKRIFLCTNIMGQSEFKEISLGQIQSIDDARIPLVGTAQLRIKGLTEVFILDLNYGQAKHLSEVREIVASATSKSQNIQIPIASQDIPEQLAKYKELFDKGVITQDEFDAKKKQLLGL